MPKISFSFSGWVNHTNIHYAYDLVTQKDIDVSQMSSNELAEKLHNGELVISLADSLDCEDGEVEIFDYEPSY